MSLDHASIKAPGQHLFAVADWNASHVIDGSTGEILFREAGGTIGTDAKLFWDDTNKRLGVGVVGNPTYTLSIGATDGEQLGIYQTPSNAYFKTTWGNFIFQSDKAVPATVTYIEVRPKGASYAGFRFYYGAAPTLVGVMDTGGAGMEFQYRTNYNVTFWNAVLEGNTKEMKIYGFRTGDILRNMQIGVGIDAADTASFDGVSNYYFDGNMGIGVISPGATLHVFGTDGIIVPIGTTAQRVATQGMIRYNTTTSKFEGYNGAAWVDLS